MKTEELKQGKTQLSKESWTAYENLKISRMAELNCPGMAELPMKNWRAQGWQNSTVQGKLNCLWKTKELKDAKTELPKDGWTAYEKLKISRMAELNCPGMDELPMKIWSRFFILKGRTRNLKMWVLEVFWYFAGENWVVGSWIVGRARPCKDLTRQRRRGGAVLLTIQQLFVHFEQIFVHFEQLFVQEQLFVNIQQLFEHIQQVFVNIQQLFTHFEQIFVLSCIEQLLVQLKLDSLMIRKGASNHS